MTVWINNIQLFMDNLKLVKKGGKVLAFPGNWCYNESIRQRTTLKGEQISYTEFEKFKNKIKPVEINS